MVRNLCNQMPLSSTVIITKISNDYHRNIDVSLWFFNLFGFDSVSVSIRLILKVSICRPLEPLLSKCKQKSLGRATVKSRSRPPTPRGREKVIQINVYIANKQMHDKIKNSSLFPKQGDQNAKRIEATHRQSAGQDQTRSAS